MNEFKIGDKVQVLEDEGSEVEGGLEAGDIAEIIGKRLIGYDIFYALRSPMCSLFIMNEPLFEESLQPYGVFYAHELELAKEEDPDGIS